jgi:hypothetical protein
MKIKINPTSIYQTWRSRNMPSAAQARSQLIELPTGSDTVQAVIDLIRSYMRPGMTVTHYESLVGTEAEVQASIENFMRRFASRFATNTVLVTKMVYRAPGSNVSVPCVWVGVPSLDIIRYVTEMAQ